MPVEVMTIQQVADAMRVTTKTIYNWVRKGAFPRPALILGRPRWRKIDVERYVEKQFEKVR